MRIVEIAPQENGAHRNQSFNGVIPDGWAVVPDNLETPNFPFGEITVDGGMPPVVTSWTAGAIPDPDPAPDPEPTEEDDTAAMLVDHEYRLTLLELGLTE